MAAGKTCLVVEIRPYGATPYDQTPNWVDNLCLTVPAGCTVYLPGGTIDTSADDATWSAVKAMFK